eukprot:GHVS01071576.1.p1 GENE.GHVS01071576.1~~GHVS01071576.1.p1  ORF type:complete len:197 (+),score=50.65 GHVS01071576.1:880-1470(+)
MSIFLRPMSPSDLLRFGNVNLDYYTETFFTSFYVGYFYQYPEMCVTAICADSIAGYVMGRVEGEGRDWHGHVTALSVAPEMRRTGLARRLMEEVLEAVSEKVFGCYYVDLFVRVSNTTAIDFYRKLGYSVFRTVRKYYSGSEDAFDMRKALAADPEGFCLLGGGEKRVEHNEAEEEEEEVDKKEGSSDQSRRSHRK